MEVNVLSQMMISELTGYATKFQNHTIAYPKIMAALSTLQALKKKATALDAVAFTCF